ncbi:MAG: ABC transporter substrate-binding protein [Gemmatimonadota bacterium]|nr:MAG: ABC transporter substrate-binding protein [Gemmatimonadota bacterium]
MRRNLLGLPAVLFTLACSGAAPEPQAEAANPDHPPDGFPVVVVDAAGVEHRFERPPSRIISLVPSATETLLALGVGPSLVARTDFDTAAAVAHLPSVGGGIDPSLELLVVHEPDLIIHFLGPNSAGTANRFAEFGIPSLAIRPDGIDDVRRIIQLFGRVTGRAALADSLVRTIDATIRHVAEAVRGRPPVRVAFLLGGDAPYAAGPGSYVDQLLTLAGGQNVFADLGQLYAQVSLESLVVRQIDVLLLPEGAKPPPGVDRTVRFVPESIQFPGPRLGEATLALAKILHPAAFP